MRLISKKLISSNRRRVTPPSESFEESNKNILEIASNFLRKEVPHEDIHLKIFGTDSFDKPVSVALRALSLQIAPPSVAIEKSQLTLAKRTEEISGLSEETIGNVYEGDGPFESIKIQNEVAVTKSRMANNKYFKPELYNNQEIFLEIKYGSDRENFNLNIKLKRLPHGEFYFLYIEQIGDSEKKTLEKPLRFIITKKDFQHHIGEQNYSDKDNFY